MKTNLIFKRVIEGRVEMMMVPVDIPQIDAGQGWMLASACDQFTVAEKPTIEQLSKQVEEMLPAALKNVPYVKDRKEQAGGKVTTIDDPTPVLNNVPAGGSYQSSVSGSARLVRYKDKIKITYRKGKTTFNRNDPNSVCINDFVKQEFFNSVKRQYGTNGVVTWQLVLGDTDYEHFNKLIDKIYEEGRLSYNESLKR